MSTVIALDSGKFGSVGNEQPNASLRGVGMKVTLEQASNGKKYFSLKSENAVERELFAQLDSVRLLAQLSSRDKDELWIVCHPLTISRGSEPL
jgi:hypothetical protein